jgi:CheY-like chemotaxis protein
MLVGAALAEAGSRRNRRVEVTEAGDGFEALWRFPRGRFDVVVTALPLPTLTGLDLIRLLRARPVPDRLTVIAISTGRSEDGDAIEAGATVSLPMPVGPADLEKALAAAGVFGDPDGC